ncbi:MAG: IPT/TIG domain-containing protein [Dysgonamonadaceae bacterium]|jgi:hypothetical protein|nr:IPT/TIG domain-containing protein [Dysgonamonadaceae bacterium]
MKTKILVLSIALTLSANLRAQVTIGSVNEPKAGAILDLNSGAKGGLVLSNVGIDHPTEIPAGFPGVTPENTDVAKAGLKGALVYNTNENTCIGIHAWNGNYWERISSSRKSTGNPLSITSNWANAIGGDNIEFTVNTVAKTYAWYINKNGAGYEYLAATTEPKLEVAIPAGTINVKVIADNCHVLEESNEATIKPESLSPNFGSTDGGNTIYLYGDFPYASTEDYVQDGLVAHFDGINNSGEGDKYHSDAISSWKNLSTTGILPDAEACLSKDCATQGLNSEFKWTGNSFSFGEYTAMTNTWLRINKPNYVPSNMQIEVTYKHRTEWTTLKGYSALLGCFESGGFGFEEYLEASTPIRFTLYTLNPTSSYKFAIAPDIISADVIYTASAGILSNATTCTQYISINGAITENVIDNCQCEIGLPQGNTVWAIGANPVGAQKNNGILHDTDLYSLRLYNRSLSAEELAQNAAADQIRYQNPPTVTIDGLPCTEVAVLSPNFLRCKVPATSPTNTGNKNVKITVGSNPTLTLNGAYKYVNKVNDFYVSNISRIIGSAGEPLTLTGNKFEDIHEVKVGNVVCTTTIVTSGADGTDTCKFNLPANSPGETDITITMKGVDAPIYRFAKIFEYK